MAKRKRKSLADTLREQSNDSELAEASQKIRSIQSKHSPSEDQESESLSDTPSRQTVPSDDSDTRPRHTKSSDGTDTRSRGGVGTVCRGRQTVPTHRVSESTHHPDTPSRQTDSTDEDQPQFLIQSKKTPFKSKNQRVLYELIQENPNIVTTYNDLHAMTAIPKTTIRDALRLFERKGLILKNKYVSSDGFQGLHIKLRHTIPTHHPDTPSRVSRSTDESSSKIDRFYLSSGRGGSTEGGVQEGGFQSDSSAEKLTSLSNADIQFHWPCLAGTGFGVHQIQQIVERLQKVEKPLTYIFQSLDHIEFELENGQLQDRNGSSVQDPCSYAFNALAKHGYYRRPHGYISSQEQAEEDARLEAEQLRKAREKKEEEEFQAWKQSLSEEEYRELIKDKKGPEEKWLKHKWREKKKF